MTDEQEFIELINQHQKIIHKIIRLYTETKDDGADLFQEILLQAWRSFKKFRGDALFSTWLYRVGLNTALTFKSQTSHQKHSRPLEATDLVYHDNGLDDQKEVLYRAIRQLSEVDRVLIGLHLDGYQPEEIGEIAGITANNVSVKLHRIKQKLSTLLTKQ
ncbi:MAG: sigma-70 family RNA polymerase sigma factor [Bacteroidota bacterium]